MCVHSWPHFLLYEQSKLFGIAVTVSVLEFSLYSHPDLRYPIASFPAFEHHCNYVRISLLEGCPPTLQSVFGYHIHAPVLGLVSVPMASWCCGLCQCCHCYYERNFSLLLPKLRLKIKFGQVWGGRHVWGQPGLHFQTLPQKSKHNKKVLSILFLIIIILILSVFFLFKNTKIPFSFKNWSEIQA